MVALSPTIRKNKAPRRDRSETRVHHIFPSSEMRSLQMDISVGGTSPPASFHYHSPFYWLSSQYGRYKPSPEYSYQYPNYYHNNDEILSKLQASQNPTKYPSSFESSCCQCFWCLERKKDFYKMARPYSYLTSNKTFAQNAIKSQSSKNEKASMTMTTSMYETTYHQQKQRIIPERKAKNTNHQPKILKSILKNNITSKVKNKRIIPLAKDVDRKRPKRVHFAEKMDVEFLGYSFISGKRK